MNTLILSPDVSANFGQIFAFGISRIFRNRSAERMRELGREYGKGLQLINILRDAGSDLANGRCYFPEEELKACGIAPNELISRRTDIAPIFEKWRQKAERGIAAGMDYCCAIRPARVRFATALPALIGARTLALLREAGAEALQKKIKVPRNEVRAIMSSTTLSLGLGANVAKKFRTIAAVISVAAVYDRRNYPEGRAARPGRAAARRSATVIDRRYRCQENSCVAFRRLAALIAPRPAACLPRLSVFPTAPDCATNMTDDR